MPVDAEDAVSYRVPADFITPYAGLYSWIIEGTIQKQGHPPATFYTDWTSLQPRIPYGPLDVLGTKINKEAGFGQAPEGWYDGVKPSTARLRAAGPKSGMRSSPPLSVVMKRLKTQ